MWKVALLAAVACIVEARPGVQFKSTYDAPFIVGGDPITKGRWAWQLSLQICTFGCGHTCGAVLISANKAITAAHCTQGRSGFQVQGGATFVGAAGDADQTVDVSASTEHPQYSGSSPGVPNDIATLALASSFTLDANVGAATLASAGENFVGATCYISGWGKLDGEDIGIPEQLHEALVDALSTQACQDRMPPNLADGVNDKHFCVHTDTEDRGSCQGDSGGPVQCQSGGSWKVGGVTSWGVGIVGGSTCLTTYPSVYTRVSEYLDWIGAN